VMLVVRIVIRIMRKITNGTAADSVCESRSELDFNSIAGKNKRCQRGLY